MYMYMCFVRLCMLTLLVDVDVDVHFCMLLCVCVGLVWVQSSELYDDLGLLSTHFIGVRMTNGLAAVEFRAGDLADAQYVLSLSTGPGTQSPVFLENSMTLTFNFPGTWWVYLALGGTTDNYDFIQIRIVPSTFQGEITAIYQNPPFSWRYGYPPYVAGSALTQGTGADASADATATAPGPIMISETSHRVASSTTIWLAPLLVGLIMAVLTVPIAMIAYNKGKKAAKSVEAQAQVEKQQQQQQQQGANRVGVACV